MNYPKILLVDDNEDLLLIIQIILKGQGYETFLATSIEEAKRKIKIHQPQLLLLDVCVGDDDGRELCRQIKSNADTKAIHIILMSGDDLGLEKNGIGDDFLAKPFDFNELIEKVKEQMTLTGSLALAE